MKKIFLVTQILLALAYGCSPNIPIPADTQIVAHTPTITLSETKVDRPTKAISTSTQALTVTPAVIRTETIILYGKPVPQGNVSVSFDFDSGTPSESVPVLANDIILEIPKDAHFVYLLFGPINGATGGPSDSSDLPTGTGSLPMNYMDCFNNISQFSKSHNPIAPEQTYCILTNKGNLVEYYLEQDHEVGFEEFMIKITYTIWRLI